MPSNNVGKTTIAAAFSLENKHPRARSKAGGCFTRFHAVSSLRAVVIDHFMQGDGTADGSRTRRTALPAAMAAVNADSVGLAYRDRMVEIALRHLPGRVGVNIDGYAGRYLA